MHHYLQNQVTGRFQEFADNWTEGEYLTPLTPLENITEVPVTMFIAPNDDTCTLDIAMEEGSRIRSKVENVVIDGYDHTSFAFSVDQDFMDLLMDHLQVEEEEGWLDLSLLNMLFM